MTDHLLLEHESSLIEAAIIRDRIGSGGVAAWKDTLNGIDRGCNPRFGVKKGSPPEENPIQNGKPVSSPANTVAPSVCSTCGEKIKPVGPPAGFINRLMKKWRLCVRCLEIRQPKSARVNA